VVSGVRDPDGRFIHGPGRQPGSRNKRTRAAELLPEDALSTLYTKLYALAGEGDVQAIRVLLDRLDPLRKGAAVELPGLPVIGDAASARAASARVLEMMADGTLSAEEAKAVQELIARHIELHDAAAVRSDLDRVLEHLGLPRETRPGELVALMANGHGDGQHRA
jgi:hypothetical protein